MGKYYGIGGKRIGSVGNETYSISKGNNIVKAKIIQVNDAKTPEQVEQRSKFINSVKAYQNISSDFLQKCFENKKQKQSSYNAFISINSKLACPFFKEESEDDNIIGIGIFQTSKGSLPILPVVNSEEITIDEVNYEYIGIEVSKTLSNESTVGAVSTDLINKYNLDEGMLINAVSVYNNGVSYDVEDEKHIKKEGNYNIDRAKQNFILNKEDQTLITSKGFTIVKNNDNAYLVILKENSNTDIHEGCIYTSSDNKQANCLGYCSYFVSNKLNNKILVSNSFTNPNDQLSKLIGKINENPQLFKGWLTTLMKILIITSYGIKKVIEIIKDWPI